MRSPQLLTFAKEENKIQSSLGLLVLSQIHPRPPQKMDPKVDAPESNLAITWMPRFEWYVVKCGSQH